MSNDLSDQLAALTPSQLATITFEAGIDTNGNVAPTNTFWDWSGLNAHTWQTALGTGADVTYTFATADDKSTFNQTAQSSAVQALALWSDLATSISLPMTRAAPPLSTCRSNWPTRPTMAPRCSPAPVRYRAGQPEADQPGRIIDRHVTARCQFDLGGSHGIPGVYDDPSDGYGVSALVHE